MVMRSVGFQLETDGKTEVKNDFAEVRAAGEAAMAGVARAAEEAGGRAARANEEFTARQIAAYQRQAAQAKLAVVSQGNQAAIDSALAGRGNAGQFATVNLDRTTGAAREAAKAFEDQFRAEEAATAAALKLKAVIDPLWAAEDRLASELAQVTLAEKSGILSAEQLATAQAAARRRYDETTDAMKRQGAAGRGLSVMQRQTLIYTASDIVASGASGASPGMIAMQQGPQVLQAFAAEEGGLAKLRALIGPTTIAVTALTAAVVLGAKSWLDYSSNVDKLGAIAQGSGRLLGLTGEQLEQNAEAAAKAGDMSISAAREIETSFVQAGRISGDVLVGLTALTKDFAAATGQDAAGAAKQLGAAFADPIAGADELAIRYGVVNQTTADYIQKLVEQNDLAGAQRVLLEALQPAFDGAADHANVLARGWNNIRDAAADAWNWMGKAIDRMVTGGALTDKIKSLEAERDRGPTVGQMLTGTSTESFRAGIQKQIDDLRYQARQDQVVADRARDNATRAQAAGIVDRYTGADQLGSLRTNAGRLRAALRTDMPPDDRAELTKTLDAYTHAIDTFIPKQEKANQLAAIDARLAAAKSPADKAALAAQRTRIEMSGQVVTSADVETAATARSTQATARATSAGAGRAESLRRQAQAMQESATAALAVADAYLKSSAAGVVADARRKAITDATRRGIDVDEQVRRQLNLQVAEGVANGAKSIAQLREETAVRAAANDNVSAGKLAVAQMNDAMSDEASLRSLLTLRAVAQAEGMTAAYDRITKAIEDYRKALGEAHAEEARSGAVKAIADSQQRVAEITASILDLSKSPAQQAIDAARRAATREADDRQFKDTDKGAFRTDFINSRVKEAEADQAGARAKYILDARDAQRDQLEMSELDLQLAGASEDVRSKALEKLRIEQEIRRTFPEMSALDVQARLRGVDAQDAVNQKLKITAAAIDEVRSFGGQFVETVLSEDTWSSWANAGKTATNMLKNEFITLALLNPLKNLINGNNNLPTLTSAIGNIGKLFGKTPGKNASGTEDWAGGLTWVAENGPELINLPQGTRISSASATRQMMTAANENGPRGDTHIHVHAQGAVLAETVRGWVAEGIQIGSAQGAAGGVALAEAEGNAKAARRLGRPWGR